MGKLHFLFRNGRYLNHYTRKLLCQALIFSNLEYCVSSWYSGLMASHREMLNVFQRKCARFCLSLGPRSHIGLTEFYELSWLPFQERVLYFNLVHLFKIKRGMSPSYLTSSFTRVSVVHSHNLRQSGENFSLAYCSSPPGTFSRDAISGWNSLPRELKVIGTLSSFKTRLKRYLRRS